MRTAERRCDRRLAAALDGILAASPEELRDVDGLTRLVGAAGLARDPRGLYNVDEVYCNRIPRGLWQISRQFARFLVFLSRRDVGTVLEVGTFTGYTFAVVMTYASRFNPGGRRRHRRHCRRPAGPRGRGRAVQRAVHAGRRRGLRGP
ncbi:MAG TPA: hypothetical protein VMT97_01040, partial [Terriglobales bacterium]|nr:hypothetical protein [Terriglobales bacterium]